MVLALLVSDLGVVLVWLAGFWLACCWRGYAPGVMLMAGCPCRVLLAGCFLLAELRDGGCKMLLVSAAGCLM
jgi:hypothetical protein